MKRRFILILPLLFGISFKNHAQNLPFYVPSDGLVGWWPFSGNAGDSSINLNHGTPVNVVPALDRFGNNNVAYSFNGANIRIEITDNPSLRCRKLTMSAWVKSDSAETRQVIYKGNINTAQAEAYSLYSHPGMSVKINSNCIAGNRWKNVTSATRNQIGFWTHYVATFDSLTLKFYINGQLDTSVSAVGLIEACIGGNLRFGFNQTAVGSGQSFSGIIDDIGIWNRAISSEEVGWLYNADTAAQKNVGINVTDPERSLHVKDVLRLEPRSLPPINTSMGDIYFDKMLGKLRVLDGISWKDCW